MAWTQEQREAHAERIRLSWQNPDIRARRTAAMRVGQAKPEAREKMRVAAIGNQKGKANKGRQHPPEVRARMNQANIGRKQSQETKNKRAASLTKHNWYKPTKIEQSVRSEIESRGIHVERGPVLTFDDGQIVANIRPDLWLPELDILIEVNGCYWHDCPQCYDDEVRPGTRERDRLRLERIASMGRQVAVVWQHEIKRDLPLAVDRLLE